MSSRTSSPENGVLAKWGGVHIRTCRGRPGTTQGARLSSVPARSRCVGELAFLGLTAPYGRSPRPGFGIGSVGAGGSVGPSNTRSLSSPFSRRTARRTGRPGVRNSSTASAKPQPRSERRHNQAGQVGRFLKADSNQHDHATIMPRLGDGPATGSVRFGTDSCGAQRLGESPATRSVRPVSNICGAQVNSTP